MLSAFYKRKETDKIWWARELDTKGKVYFSFDKKTLFNFFRDYPGSLTQEQKALFDMENPEWAAFYKGDYPPEE